MTQTIIINFPQHATHLEWRKRVLRQIIRAEFGGTEQAARAWGFSPKLIQGVIGGYLKSRPMQDRLAELAKMPVEALFPERAAKVA